MDTTRGRDHGFIRACLEAVAADDRVDAVLAVAVPTAISDLRAALSTPVVSKPIAAALLDQAESVRLLGAGRSPGPRAPGDRAAGAGARRTAGGGRRWGCPYAYPEDAARALGHAARYRAWRNGGKAASPS